jgi:large subunit ribosomal protein L22e
VASAAPSAAPRTPVATAPYNAPAAMPRVAQAAPQARVEQSQPFVNIPAPPAAAPRVLQPAANEGVIQAQPQMMAAQVQPRGVVMQRVPEDPYAGPVITATQAPRPLAHKPAAPKAVAKNDAKPASAADDLQARAEAIAKTLNGKPAAIAKAKAEASKPAPVAAKPAAPLPKAVARVEMSKPADAKAVPVKATGKNAIPALRLSANAF